METQQDHKKLEWKGCLCAVHIMGKKGSVGNRLNGKKKWIRREKRKRETCKKRDD